MCSKRRLTIALLLAVAPFAAAADDPTQPVAPVAAPPGANVGLDSLLRLPPNIDPEPARTGGATRQEWEQRFANARGDLKTAQDALDKAQQDLTKLAEGKEAWQMSAPGLGQAAQSGENSPMSFKLRQEIRRQREEVASAEKRLNELEVEAKLAGVPDDWIHPGAPPPKPAQDALAR
jgi:hypothetical protein